MLDVYKKPKVSEISSWVKIFESEKVAWTVAENNPYFYQVKVKNNKPQYFYGENAYHDSYRAATDADPKTWDSFY